MTLLCIAGLLHPDSGFIQLNDRVLFDSTKKLNLPPKDRNVGFVFQNYALFPHLSAGKNIAYGIRNRSPEEVNRRVHVLIENRASRVCKTDIHNSYPQGSSKE